MQCSLAYPHSRLVQPPYNPTHIGFHTDFQSEPSERSSPRTTTLVYGSNSIQYCLRYWGVASEGRHLYFAPPPSVPPSLPPRTADCAAGQFPGSTRVSTEKTRRSLPVRSRKESRSRVYGSGKYFTDQWPGIVCEMVVLCSGYFTDCCVVSIYEVPRMNERQKEAYAMDCTVYTGPL